MSNVCTRFPISCIIVREKKRDTVSNHPLSLVLYLTKADLGTNIHLAFWVSFSLSLYPPPSSPSPPIVFRLFLFLLDPSWRYPLSVSRRHRPDDPTSTKTRQSSRFCAVFIHLSLSHSLSLSFYSPLHREGKACTAALPILQRILLANKASLPVLCLLDRVVMLSFQQGTLYSAPFLVNSCDQCRLSSFLFIPA